MIYGKAKLEFGTGTVSMVPAIMGDGVGVLFLKSCDPHEIGKLEPMGDEWKPDHSEVIMTFTNPASVKALITDLAHVYKYLLAYECNGIKSIPDDHWGKKFKIDLETFIKEK